MDKQCARCGAKFECNPRAPITKYCVPCRPLALREKKREYLRRWQRDNPDKNRASKLRHRVKNSEKLTEYARKYRAANLEVVQKRYKKYCLEHQEELKRKRQETYQRNKDCLAEGSRKRAAEWRKANLERSLKRANDWHHKNKERVKARRRNNKTQIYAWNSNRRAKLAGASGTHDAGDISLLYKLQRGKCATCKKTLSAGYHVDHIQPISKGGSSDVDNLQLLCPTCNLRKNAKDPYEWARENGKLF